MIQIDTAGRILIDHSDTGLAVAQHLAGTTIVRPECRFTGKVFQEIRMPKNRYTLSTDAGRAEFETDIKAAISREMAA